MRRSQSHHFNILLMSSNDLTTLKTERTLTLLYPGFPILIEDDYYGRLPDTYNRPCAKHSLLSLSMALVVSIPEEHVTPESFSSLYMLVKSSIAIVEAANIHSLEVVQSRLLLCLFEVGHAIEPAAFMSLGTTARAAAAIGLNQKLDNAGSPSDEACSMREVGLRVWWGIVMVDRFESPHVVSDAIAKIMSQGGTHLREGTGPVRLRILALLKNYHGMGVSAITR